MWNRSSKAWIYIYIYIYKGTKIDAYYARKQETEKLGLGFLGRIMCTHEQACVHSQDYAHVGFSPETLATQQTEQNFKTLNLTS